MKKLIPSCIVIMLFAIAPCLAFAQDIGSKKEYPEWVCENGYWVVETNKKTPKSNIIYFYNNENELIYKEQVKGVKMRLNRPKVLLHLKHVLDQSLLAWQQQRVLKENQMLVSAALKK